MKVTKEYKYEMEGMAHALRVAKEQGIDALEKELKMRGCANMPLIVSNTKGENWMKEMELTIFQTMILMSVTILYDKFGFRKQRIDKYINEFNYRVSCLDHGFVCWEDMQEEMMELLGLEFPISELVGGHREELSKEYYDELLSNLKKRVANGSEKDVV